MFSWYTSVLSAYGSAEAHEVPVYSVWSGQDLTRKVR
jgi:hypothetical protein